MEYAESKDYFTQFKGKKLVYKKIQCCKNDIVGV